MQRNKQTAHIDQLGRIALPRDMIDTLGWSEETEIDFWLSALQKDNYIILRENYSVHRCVYCNATKNLKPFRDQYICDACRQSISDL